MRTRFYDRELRAGPTDAVGVQPYAWNVVDGAMEMDPEELLAHVARAIDGAVASPGDPVAAVGVTTFWHSLMGTDRRGRPLTPLYGWGDTRARPAATRLHRLLDAEPYHQRTGCFLQASYPLARLAWLREMDPAAFDRVERWMSFGEFLEMRLFGAPRASLSMASGTGLFDLRRRTWDSASLGAVGIEEVQLSPLVDYTPVTGLAAPWAGRWPMLAGVPWYPALGDGACANVGDLAMGVDQPGVTIGTSAAARVLWEAEPDEDIPGHLWCYLLTGRHRVAGGALSNGGNGLAFLTTRFRGVKLAELSEAVARTEPDEQDVTVIPSLIPERSLGWQEIDSGSILGLGPDTTSQQIAVAWLHAIAGRIAELVGHIETRFGPAAVLSANGGALHAVPGWAQVLADATGRRVRFGDDPEATIRGVARMLADALGWQPLEEQRTRQPGRMLEPRPEWRAAHRRALERQKTLARTIRQSPVDPDPSDLDT